MSRSAPLRLTRGARFVDPEWGIFFGVLLGPSMLCVLLGDRDRADFFARLALYLGFLKWLGWALLTRGRRRVRSPFSR